MHKMLFNHLLPYPRRMRAAVKAAAAPLKGDLAPAAKAMGLLRFLGPEYQRGLEIVGRLPQKTFRSSAGPKVFKGDGQDLHILYFVGCGMDLIFPDAASATLKVLKRTARQVTVLDNVCCGLPAETYGDRTAAARLAKTNLDVMEKQSHDLIVTDCSSCASFLKKYPDLFEPDDPARERAAKTSNRVKDLLEILDMVPSSKRSSDLSVTYHDPCHAVRGQGLAKQPREALARIGGLELRDMKEADWCCGGSGSYAFYHYDLARKVLDRKLDHIQETQAQAIATSCPACMMHLSHGMARRGLNMKTLHISQILAEE